MNDDQATLIRIYQYLLSKDVFVKERIIDVQKNLQRKNLKANDIFDLYYALIKVEIWEEFFRDMWKLLE